MMMMMDGCHTSRSEENGFDLGNSATAFCQLQCVSTLDELRFKKVSSTEIAREAAGNVFL